MSIRSFLLASDDKLASRLKHRITIEAPNNIADGAGGVTKGWSEFKSVWAEIKPYSGAETLQGMQVTGSATHVIIIRYVSGVDTSMRISFGDRTFNIRAVANLDELGKAMVIEAQEGVAT